MKISNLVFSYRDKPIFKDFCLDISTGQVTSVMGSSGGGKTTLLNCISGQLNYQGDIFYGQNSDKKLEDIKISYIFQQPRLIPSLSVEDNIKFVLSGRDKSFAKEKTDEMIKKLCLEDCRNSYPSHISGGQASRTAIARALAIDSDILLMDEPFKGLDIKLKNYILGLLKPLISDKTVIFVTHDVEEALAMADRVVVLSRQDGETVKIVEDLAINESKEDRDLYGDSLNKVRKTLSSALLK